MGEGKNHAKNPMIRPPGALSGIGIFFFHAVLVLYLGYFVVSSIARNALYHEPVTLWRSVVEHSPEKRRAHQNYGQALSAAGALQAALREFRAVLSLPEDGSVPQRDVYREIGVVYFRLNLLDESIQMWSKGLQYAPADAGILSSIAIAKYYQGQYDAALDQATKAAAADPNLPEPFNTLGEIYIQRGEYGKAIESFRQFLRLRPEDGRGHWNLAVAFERNGQPEEALRSAQAFLVLAKNGRFEKTASELVHRLEGSLGRQRESHSMP